MSVPASGSGDTAVEPVVNSATLDGPTSPIVYRSPVVTDGADMHGLARAVGLDVNSIYSYLLVTTHFAETSAVAVRAGRLTGFVSGYLEPADPTVLFIWQVAVDPTERGRGVARRLLAHVLDRAACSAVRFLEATVTPSNDASHALFRRVARDRDAHVDLKPAFDARHFGAADHEPEELLRIGPLRRQLSPNMEETT